ncbi:MAG TPA: hypothetical protein VGE27_13190 [Gemmatimonas sp.]|uniref:hypothetical protein n=1 Tax=Gemmatimonas sp. TaxID=1962908 RepID=UPI002EDAF553
MVPSRASAAARLDEPSSAEQGPLVSSDTLARTAAETCRQHERLSKLMALAVSTNELQAAHAMVDTIDLALAEAVKDFEKKCAKVPVTEAGEVRSAANAMWLSAREYLRRHSIAEKASRLITQGDDTLGDLHFEYELEASALLGLKQATSAYQKLRPEARC